MLQLDVRHDSQHLFYREPFGAVSCGGKIQLRLEINTHLSPVACELRIWRGETEKTLTMKQSPSLSEKANQSIFEVDYTAP